MRRGYTPRPRLHYSSDPLKVSYLDSILSLSGDPKVPVKETEDNRFLHRFPGSQFSNTMSIPLNLNESDLIVQQYKT